MSNEIELYSKANDHLQAVEAWGTSIGKSGMFGCQNIDSGKVIMLICMSERITPTQFLRTYDLVDGKPRKKAMASLAEFRARGGKYRWLKTGDEVVAKEEDRCASAEFEFEGNKIVVSFTIAQAKLQGLVREKSNWVKTPANMLRARVASNAVGMLCPEIFAGDDSEFEQAPAPSLNLSLIHI